MYKRKSANKNERINELIYIVALEIAAADKKFSRTEYIVIKDFVRNFFSQKISDTEIKEKINFYSHFKLNFIDVKSYPSKIRDEVFRLAHDIAISDSHFKLSELHKLIEIGKILQIDNELVNLLLTDEKIKWSITFKIAEHVANAIHKNNKDKMNYMIHILQNTLLQVDLSDEDVHKYYQKYKKIKLADIMFEHYTQFTQRLLLKLTFELSVNKNVSLSKTKQLIIEIGESFHLNDDIINEAIEYSQFRPIFIIARESVLADGIVTVEEMYYLIDLMKKITHNHLANPNEIIKYIKRYNNQSLSTKEIDKIPHNVRRGLFCIAINIMKSDHKITYKELEKLAELSKKLKLSAKTSGKLLLDIN